MNGYSSSDSIGNNFISLPIFITKENKYLVLLVGFSISLVMYLSANHIHFFTPQLLPLCWIDSAVPFLPHTVWIYLSEYVFLLSVYLICKDLVNLSKYLYSYLTLQTVSVLIFLIWPTTYPRDQFPLPDNLDSITHYAFSSLRAVDSPANCCPSLHVSSVYLASFIFLDDQRKKFPFFFIWGTAIALTTLTTKQHYLIDVICGFLMAVLTYWIFHKYITYRPMVKNATHSHSLQ